MSSWATRCSLLDADQHVDPPVGLHSPAQVLTGGDLLQEVVACVLLAALLLQRLPEVAHVLCCAELGDARQQHQGEERDQQAGLGVQRQVGLRTDVLQQTKQSRQSRAKYMHCM